MLGEKNLINEHVSRYINMCARCGYLILALMLAGCTYTDSKKQSNFTPGVVKESIVKGVTTQNDLVKLFGSPNIVSKDKDGKEVWTYSKHSASTNSKNSFFSFLIGGAGSAYGNTSSASFSLVITFNDRNVVEDYSMTSSEF